MVDLYEFKIRFHYDCRDWSEIGLYALRPASAASAEAYARDLARYDEITEVRYNKYGHGMYHHVSVTDDEKIYYLSVNDVHYQNMYEIAEDMILLEISPERFRDLAQELADRRGLSLP